MASGDNDDDLLKTIIDNCHLIDVTIHLKNESKKDLLSALWNTAENCVYKRDREKAVSLMYAIKEVEDEWVVKEIEVEVEEDEDDELV